ncbi:DnaJ domain-containing protein [Solirubrobacter ginsenosidimutans]|uniref:DnaJ domain-containing protein n=1 Tax=Solirubrobacter ginsenosidimutans TaxID=490573 RepID=A0A9X3N5N3_9ACTN|nr:DnaJ domain-containing protein [Solirubrobacter ginsenosidimutans]MDA0167047.1 DnaJ domain-containing protein [Solirubrobacter ginsenosidimutans]
MRRDPYQVLEVSPGASSEELHDAYRRLVKLHHPDRNGGSEESARRFAEIQEAYEEVRTRPRPRAHRAAKAAESVKERMATLERELREAQAARERARRDAREAARDVGSEPPPVTTEDSVGKILGDIREELADRIAEGRQHPSVQKVSELIDDVIARLDRR